ncbi:hypothetical protein V1477_011465 [Vespula maculifrons]|uniref:Uncharacterized protein n=1 Tax=Vespula maculifrons TaxID=7453 RepID=A0ABD2BZ99_VESMC
MSHNKIGMVVQCKNGHVSPINELIPIKLRIFILFDYRNFNRSMFPVIFAGNRRQSYSNKCQTYLFYLDLLKLDVILNLMLWRRRVGNRTIMRMRVVVS